MQPRGTAGAPSLYDDSLSPLKVESGITGHYTPRCASVPDALEVGKIRCVTLTDLTFYLGHRIYKHVHKTSS